MQQTNKKPNNDIWKVIAMFIEVMLLSMIVVYFFTEMYQARPEKSRFTAIAEETYLKESDCSFNEGPLLLVMTKDCPDPLTFEEIVASYVFDICKDYPDVDPYLILSIIYQESRFAPNVSNGGCVGLMQISEYWHRDRAAKLGVTDFWDPYSNVLLGIDLVNELLDRANGDIYYALMLYNQTYSSARKMYTNGIISNYARDVVERADEYREGYFV